MAPVYNDIVRVFKAFCDENRLAILDMLRTGEKCACVFIRRATHYATYAFASYEDTM